MQNLGWTNIGDMEKKAKGIAKDVSDAAEGLVNNTINEDLPKIFRGAENCLNEIDRIRLRLTKRAIEYHTTINRILLDTQLFPADLLEAVYESISGDL
ncbi:hypothetical protein V7127_23345, partial [Bacillus sp. JJ1773]|uniref:hypothetical protein n=1 Tax=Bacillus sp. JJ1773 TaxID=3122965 RepID=UPI003000DB1A